MLCGAVEVLRFKNRKSFHNITLTLNININSCHLEGRAASCSVRGMIDSIHLPETAQALISETAAGNGITAMFEKKLNAITNIGPRYYRTL